MIKQKLDVFLHNRNKIAILSFCIFFAFLLLFPLANAGNQSYILHVLIMCMIYACVTSSWNVIAGYAGVFSFGFQALFGTGAYVSALLSKNLGLSPWVTIFIGAFAATCVGSVVAIPSIRLKKTPYICIATMCMGELVRIIVSNLTDITRGEMGLTNIPRLFKSNNRMFYYYLMVMIFVAILLITIKTINSPIGMSLQAMKGSQEASDSLGINIAGTKIKIYMIGAFMAGITGGFYAHYIGVLTPTSVLGTPLMTQYVAMSLIGGIGTIVGPIFGSFFVTMALELLRALEEYRMIIYSLLIIITIIFMREGIWGSLKSKILSWTSRYKQNNK